MGNEWTPGTDQWVSIWFVLRAHGVKLPFASAVDVLTVITAEFVMDKRALCSNRIQPCKRGWRR